MSDTIKNTEDYIVKLKSRLSMKILCILICFVPIDRIISGTFVFRDIFTVIICCAMILSMFFLKIKIYSDRICMIFPFRRIIYWENIYISEGLVLFDDIAILKKDSQSKWGEIRFNRLIFSNIDEALAAIYQNGNGKIDKYELSLVKKHIRNKKLIQNQ